MIKKPHRKKPLLRAICHKESFFVLWHTMMVCKAFCRSTGGKFGKSTVSSKGNSIFRVNLSFYSEKNLTISSMIEVAQHNLPPQGTVSCQGLSATPCPHSGSPDTQQWLLLVSGKKSLKLNPYIPSNSAK